MAAPHLRDLMARGVARLRDGEIETPELDAALLLGYLLGHDRAALYARMLDPSPPDVPPAFDALIERRLRHEPVAYLTGTKEFMGLPFAVNASVLVPRPETELLVEWARRWLDAHPGAAHVVDVGTGSGAIAIALASTMPRIRAIASDISLAALSVARWNARQNGVAERVAFICGDLASWLGRPMDLMLANLPYLTDAQSNAPTISVEPRGALAGGGGDGFGLYRALIPQVATRLAVGGAFAFEIDPSQVTVARALCEQTFASAFVTVHQDLAGGARFVTVEMAASSARLLHERAPSVEQASACRPGITG
ncbi:MAG: peptide chain release factor N(5)-glutamine methyltransferase [Thermomicrobia bacterium]|nr:peptide chain release factor N(5)-glutamine methyltransferase [Thermomicrobia bacterium]